MKPAAVLVLAGALLLPVGCGRAKPKPKAVPENATASVAAPARNEPRPPVAPAAKKNRWQCPKCGTTYDAAGWCCGAELTR